MRVNNKIFDVYPDLISILRQNKGAIAPSGKKASKKTAAPASTMSAEELLKMESMVMFIL